MTGPAGFSRLLKRVLPAAAAALLSGAILAAAGSLEAIVRAAADPDLADGRLDVAAYAWWAAVAGACAGLAAGAPAGAALGGPWGAGAAATAAPIAVLAAWAAAVALEAPAGRGAAAWLGAAAGIAAGAACGAFVSRRPRATRPGGGPARCLRWAAAAAAAPALVLAGLHVRAAAGPRLAAGSAPSFLLVTVDTLRADALGAFRDGRPVPVPLERAATPKLDALASESAVFLEAATPIPKTPQAIASLMTALYPGAHGVRDLFSRLDRSRLTLAEVLRERGYRTRAVVTNMLVGRGSGLSQGFDRYRDKDGLRPQVKRLAVVDLLARLAPAAATWCLNRFEALRMGREDAAETTDRALEALAEVGGAPYFLWVHYLDPHWIYWAPEPHRSAADARPGEPFRLYDDVRSGRVKIGEMIHRNAMSREEVERVRSLYAGEVSYIDAEVGRLLDAALAGAGARSTLVVFTSDHGESLGEHGYFFSHGDQVHEPSLRVPLIVRPPAGGAGKVVREPVGLVDVMPTALEILGAPIPARIQGISLTSLAGADGGAGGGPAAAAARVLFGESDLSYLAENPLLTIPGEAGKMRSIRSGSLKLVRIPRDVEAARRVDPDLGASNAGRRNALGFEEATRLGPSGPDVVALYDLAADPAETRDLAPEEPARSAALLEALDAWVRASAGPPGAEREGSRELLEGLRSLGYVDPGGGAP